MTSYWQAKAGPTVRWKSPRKAVRLRRAHRRRPVQHNDFFVVEIAPRAAQWLQGLLLEKIEEGALLICGEIKAWHAIITIVMTIAKSEHRPSHSSNLYLETSAREKLVYDKIRHEADAMRK